MRKSPVTTKVPAEQVVKDIRRATRKALGALMRQILRRAPDTGN